ncbi:MULTISPECIES: hypothetical protein [Enterococcus]|uniref:hypothetical protein n=1 Tax=Enterococcus TaxID=1350 RepID=UPI000A3776B0|nr:hypothetical protein [Enterococcus sp. 4E1_DIV0656]OTO09103.1 hypothetical protein A5882_003433 [Enterococcus sp. 4E1_DIV0656]
MANYYSNDKYDASKSSSSEYFSGSNVRVFFNNKEIEEMTSIQFQMNENVQPIYGFNSYTFDRIARGNRIVQGQFSMNFVTKGYLQDILKALCSTTDEGVANTESSYTNVSSADENIKMILNAKDSAAAAALKADLKNSLWGSEKYYNSTVSNTRYQDSHFYSGDTEDLKSLGFDIRIEYSPDANDVDFQNSLRNLGSGNSAYHTYRILNEVHIYNISQVVGNDGQVIQETYSFLAKDVDGEGVVSTALDEKYTYKF